MGVKTIWELWLFQVAPFVSFQGLQMVIFVFWTERDWSQKCCYGNTIEGVILFFFLCCTFVVPSFKNAASIFWEISFIQYFTIFSCKQYDVITDLICIIEKCQYLWNEKRYVKNKSAILLYLERPFKEAENIFHVICTLKTNSLKSLNPCTRWLKSSIKIDESSITEMFSCNKGIRHGDGLRMFTSIATAHL